MTMGRQLYEATAEPKRLVTYPGVGHNDWPGGHGRQWLSAIFTFLGEALP